ncbi:MAG: hypothetical protein H0U86_03425 [Chloroflexi bacterium]|nr:hypothetical protein [Chloroflexota bacterium]
MPSKGGYLPDDDGPSYWWRDKIVERLLTDVEGASSPVGILKEAIDRIGDAKYEVLQRLEDDIDRQRVGRFDNVDSSLRSLP